MRKYIRKILKYNAEKQSVKASKWVHNRFEQLQIKKYKKKRRDINKAKGTHPRHNWKARIALYVE